MDDIYNVGDILAEKYKKHLSFKITKNETIFEENTLHIGYLKLDKIALQYKYPILIKKAPRVFGMLFYLKLVIPYFEDDSIFLIALPWLVVNLTK